MRIAGSSVVTDTLALHDRPDPLAFRRRPPLGRARLPESAHHPAAGRPLRAVRCLFDLRRPIAGSRWFCRARRGLEAGARRRLRPPPISLHGSLPISTLGGLKARGNPGGATGVYQAVEAVLQLRGQAGQNQVAGRAPGADPVPGRPGLHRRHPRAGSDWIRPTALSHGFVTRSLNSLIGLIAILNRLSDSS